MTIPLLDHLTVKIERRFDHGSISVYSGLVIIPSKMASLVYKNVNWKKILVYLLIFSKMTEPPTKFSKSGGLTGPQISEVNCWERGGDLFQGVGCNFHVKNKLKSEHLMLKKVYKQKYFSMSLLRIQSREF